MYNQILYTILKHYCCGESVPFEFIIRVNEDEWLNLYKASVQQGVVAIVYGMIMPFINDVTIPRKIKLQWALQAEKIEHRTQEQFKIANELSDIYKYKGIETVVLKGVGLGIYYSKPQQRECGDFDCYLFNEYQKGLDIAKTYGAKIGHIDYKHAQLTYKGLSVEIHKYFTSFRGEKAKHLFEQTLNNLMQERQCKPISKGSNILIADPTFNAVFVTYHTLFHFLFESVKLRHILDWGLMVKVEQNSIDWELFASICAEHKMLKFAEAITAICNDYLGLKLQIPIKAESEYRDKVLMDIFSYTDGVSNKKGWERRYQLLKNTYKARWKYQLIDSTYFSDLVKRVFYFIFSNDKLKTS